MQKRSGYNKSIPSSRERSLSASDKKICLHYTIIDPYMLAFFTMLSRFAVLVKSEWLYPADS